MAIDWYTFTAAEWTGFTPVQWDTFLAFQTYDPIRVWSEASAVFQRDHVIGHYTATAAQAVLKKRASKTIITAAVENAAWKADD